MGLKHRHNYESVTQSLLAEEKQYLPASYAGQISVALVYPNLYSLGMSNLGFLTVHRLLSGISGVGVERFFPALSSEILLSPPFYSFETGRPLGDFSIIMFSFSYEGDFDKIPGIFSALGMPVHAAERNRFHPVLVAGGAAVASNIMALSGIFDVLVPGEAETSVVEMVERIIANGFDPTGLAEIPGVWVPALGQKFLPVEKMHDVDAEPAWSHIVAPTNAFGGAHMIEIMRGCPRFCSFCLARAIYSPVRAVSAHRLEQWLNARPDCNDLGLVAPSLFDHVEVEEIFEMLASRGVRIRNSSVKWEKLNPKILKILADSGVRGLTLAPETGSESLRRLIRKPMDDNRFMESLRQIFASGFSQVKLYFIACLPGESEEDVEATVAFLQKIADSMPTSAKISAAFSIFVPKNHTLFAEEPAPDAGFIKKRLKLYREKLGKLCSEMDISFESIQEAVRQAWLSKAGIELADEYAREARLCRENQLFSKNQFSPLEF